MQTPKRSWALPHTYVLLFVLIVFAAALTWVVPSGEFERQQLEIADGYVASTVVPGTFRPIEKISDEADLRQGLFDVLSAPAKGIVHAADVIAFVLVVGGALGILIRTGAIDRGLHALATSSRASRIHSCQLPSGSRTATTRPHPRPDAFRQRPFMIRGEQMRTGTRSPSLSARNS